MDKKEVLLFQVVVLYRKRGANSRLAGYTGVVAKLSLG